MSGWGTGTRALFVVGSLIAGIVGWFTASHVGATDRRGTAAGTVNIYSCPMQGAVSIGQLHGGDAVWLMGISDQRWAVIRHPNTPDRPAWVPLAMIRTGADTGDLPEIGCDPDPATGTTAPGATTPPSTAVGATTTSTTTTSSTSTTTTSTLPSDHTPPVVTVTTDRDYLYVSQNCPGKNVVTFTIVVADPSLPLRIRSVAANWSGAGGAPPVTLTDLKSQNRWSMVITGSGPASGAVTVTITVTAEDGARNVGTGTTTVQLRSAADGCA